jgi:hypothetical protein
MKVLIAIALLTSVAFAQAPPAAKAAPPPAVTQEDAAARERQLFEADQKHDLDAVRNIVADDFVDIARDGSSMGKNALLDEIPKLKLLHYQQSNFRLTPLGAHAYALTYDSDATLINAEGKEQRSHNVLNSVWIWRDGRWQMLLHSRGAQLPTS